VSTGNLTLSNPNVYAGATFVSYGAIGGALTGGTLTLNNFGSILSTSGITLNGANTGSNNSTLNGGQLTLDNNAFNLVDNGTTSLGRLGNATPLTLIAGQLNFAAANNPGVAAAEAIGPVTLAGGQSIVRTGYMT